MLIRNISNLLPHVGHSIGGGAHASALFKPSTFAMFWGGDSAVAGQTEKSSFFISSAPHYTLAFAPQGGGMSGRLSAEMTFSSSADLAAGMPIDGFTSISFSQSGLADLIVSGSGSTTLTFSQSGDVLAAASGSGSTTLTFSQSGSIMGTAELTGSSALAFAAALDLYAIGYMQGSTETVEAITPASVARAVWQALASESGEAGTMGEKLNDAGSGGNPWAAALADNQDPGTFGEWLQKLLTTAKFLGLK